MRLINNDPIIQLRKKISESKYFKFFLETTFLYVPWYPVRYWSKTFFRFFEIRSYPSIHNFGLEAYPLQYELGSGSPAIRGTYQNIWLEPKILLSQNFFKSKFFPSQNFFQVKIFQIFSGNHFSPRSMIPCSLLIENIFSVFEVCTYPSIHNFGLEAYPLQHELGRQVSPLGFAIRARKRGAWLQRYVSKITPTEIFLSQTLFKKIIFIEILNFSGFQWHKMA